MFGHWQIFRPPASDFPDSLISPQPQPAGPGRRLVLILALAVACFLPRAMMAERIPAIVWDGPYYIRIAQRLEQRDFKRAFADLRLNVYPVILMLLHQAGLEWETAGKLWSVVMSTLVVLPLFGWVRRQFDIQIATVACLLYCVHPSFIEWSPETIRDPTFWFLTMATLYLTWRAIAETRLWLYLAAGVCFTLAVHVRTEAWLLCIPFGLWSFWRWLAPSVAGLRQKLAVGGLTYLAATPALLLIVNFTWLHGYPHWELGRFNHLQLLSEWQSSEETSDSDNAGRSLTAILPERLENTWRGLRSQFVQGVSNPAARVFAANPQGISHSFNPSLIGQGSLGTLTASESSTGDSWKDNRLWMFSHKLLSACELAYGILLLVGLFGWRKVFFSRPQQAVFYMNMVLMAWIWLYLAQRKEINSRYFFIAVLTAAPYAALGLLAICDRAATLVRDASLQQRLRTGMIVGLLASISFYGMADAWSSDYQLRSEERNLGEWVRKTYGPGQLVIGTASAGLVGFYSQGRYQRIPENADRDTVTRIVSKRRATVLVVDRNGRASAFDEHQERIVAQATDAGFKQFVGMAPDWRKSVILFVRDPRTAQEYHLKLARSANRDARKKKAELKAAAKRARKTAGRAVICL